MTKRLSHLDVLAKEQAIQDMRESLKEEGKCLLMFRKDLNPVMKNLVDNYYQ